MVNPGHAEIADLIGAWARGHEPLYQQLAAAMKQAIGRYELLPGTRLPSERELGRQLAISRTTVLAAYELLKLEGVLESRQGSGTWISYRLRSLDSRLHDTDPAASLTIERVLNTPTSLVPSIIDLATGAFPDALLLPDLMAEVAGMTSLDTTPSPYLAFGHAALREAIAAHLRRIGIDAVADEVIVTAGIQQGAYLLARTELAEGDTVIVEDPTWTGLLDVLRSVGVRLVGVPAGDHGIDPDLLETEVRRHKPTLIFVSPDVHNPTGARLPADARSRIAALSARYGVPVVEDLALRGLAIDGEELPAISTFAGAGQTYAVGTLSKVFWPGLRVGWVRAPQPVINRLGRQRAVMDCGSDLIAQAIATRALARWEQLAAHRRGQLRTAYEAFQAELRCRLPDCGYTRPAGGLSCWLRLPAGNATTLSQLALRRQVEVVPGPAYSAAYGSRDRLRISLARPIPVLAEGLRRLACAWSEYRSAC